MHTEMALHDLGKYATVVLPYNNRLLYTVAQESNGFVFNIMLLFTKKKKKKRRNILQGIHFRILQSP